MSSQGLVTDDLSMDGNFASDDNWYIYDQTGDQDGMTPDVIPDCHPTIPYDLYHACMAPVSLAVLLILSLLVKRKKLYKNCWDGAPGLLSPVQFLEEEGHKGLSVAVFGILFSSLCILVLDNDPLPFISGSSTQNREYWKIMALLYYPAFYYPLIACATVRHRAGYFLGCLLSWCHCVVHLWQKVECPQSPKIYRYYSLLSYLPIILCLAVLSLWYPAQLVKSFKEQKRKKVMEELPGSGYCEDYLKNILAKRMPNKRMAEAHLNQGNACESQGAHLHQVCFVSSLVVSCLLTFCMLMKSMGKHRINLQRLYQGAVTDVFYRSRKIQPSQQALVCWMCFASFQTAFACLGLLIQHIVFFVCTVIFTFFVVIPLQSGSNMLLFKIMENMWPFWLTLVLAVVAQNLLTHYYFLERGRLPKELTNRRALYIVTFLLFPINVLVGVLAGVWRMVGSALYNVVHFCRLDVSMLGHGVEVFDPGYRTYCHYLKIEVSQSHPVMKAFCFLLLQVCKKGPQPRDVEEGVKLMKTKAFSSKGSKGKRSRARWFLAYTLLNNPSLLPYRKGALLDSTVNGMQANPAKP
nr:receptor for retinol uptake STRA6 [Zootoca vivipara]